jgi:hypothetical protein
MVLACTRLAAAVVDVWTVTHSVAVSLEGLWITLTLSWGQDLLACGNLHAEQPTNCIKAQSYTDHQLV